MTLYWGGRTRGDLYMNALAEAWQREHGIGYVPVLSEARAEDHWSGRTGFVHRAVMADYPDLSGHQVYACGAPAMVEALSLLVRRMGMAPEHVHADAFYPGGV